MPSAAAISGSASWAAVKAVFMGGSTVQGCKAGMGGDLSTGRGHCSSIENSTIFAMQFNEIFYHFTFFQNSIDIVFAQCIKTLMRSCIRCLNSGPQMKNSTLEISYESENFSPARIAKSSGSLQINWDDILWAAITVGRPNLYYVFRYGRPSGYEAIFRYSLVRMALEQCGSNLCRTNAFNSLDPTEKGAITYFLGMTFCKLFAEKFLSTPWLLHLDVFRQTLNPSMLKGRSRPDMVGKQMQSGEWHAFECKGRSSSPGQLEKQKAKGQAQRLLSINGIMTRLHIGAITYFKRNTLHFYWCDPEPHAGELKLDLELPEQAWQAYYGPSSELIRMASDSLIGVQKRQDMFYFPEVDVFIGAHPKIFDHLIENRWQEAHDISLEFFREFLKEGYRTDGLKVKSGDSWYKRFDGRAIL